ncbi:HalOD1 output domain-containing protein [Halosolutus gelatinilyticus]|uniref:HalOD1 output domain-containing protein n=1 Tax=Halosolutus gelatinilyticus TaxID=2931975 RepID=UPI001FF50990|nr:HalOD1 output domain-containing protein [Halosolutus gelatinilyticus]
MEGGGDGIDTTVYQSPSQSVVETIAAVEGISAEELGPPEYEPLHTVVDPAALDALFARRTDGRPRSSGTVSFAYCGYEVTVERDGSVSLEDREG